MMMMMMMTKVLMMMMMMKTWNFSLKYPRLKFVLSFGVRTASNIISTSTTIQPTMRPSIHPSIHPSIQASFINPFTNSEIRDKEDYSQFPGVSTAAGRVRYRPSCRGSYFGGWWRSEGCCHDSHTPPTPTLCREPGDDDDDDDGDDKKLRKIPKECISKKTEIMSRTSEW